MQDYLLWYVVWKATDTWEILSDTSMFWFWFYSISVKKKMKSKQEALRIP